MSKPAAPQLPRAPRSHKARHRGERGRTLGDAQARRSRKRQQKWTLCIAIGAATMLVTVIAVVFVVSSIVHATPGWWSPPDRRDPATRALAIDVERRLSETLTDIRPHGEEWSVRLTSDEASAWIAVRLPQWLRAEGIAWPLAGRDFDLAFTPTGARFAAPIEETEPGDRPRIATAEVSFTVDGAGGVFTALEGVSLGRLALPTGWARGHLLAAAQQASVDPLTVSALLSGERPLRDAVIPIDAHRRVRILEVIGADDAVTLRCTTELRSRVDDEP